MRDSDKGVYKRIELEDVGKWYIVCGDCGLAIITDETRQREMLVGSGPANKAGFALYPKVDDNRLVL